MTQNNPFFSAFKSFGEQFNSNLHQMDLNDLSTAFRKNLEVANAAQQALTEGAQNFFQRQFEIFQSNMETILELSKEIASSKDPREAASKQAEATKRCLEKAASDANELVAIVSKTSNQTCEILGKQASENIKEISKAASTAASAASNVNKKKAAA